MPIFCSFFIDFEAVETTRSRGSVATVHLIYLNKYTPKGFDDIKTSNKSA